MELFTVLFWIIISLAGTTLVVILGEKYGLEIVAGAVAGLAVLANILASAKVLDFSILGYAPAGIIAWSLIALVLDIVNELHGPEKARKLVIAGFVVQAIAVVLIWIVLVWAPAPFLPADKAAAANLVLSWTPQLFGAALLAFLVSNVFDIHIFSRLRKATRGRHLWFRSKVSTFASMFIGNIIFITLGFLGTQLQPQITPMIFGHFEIQLVIAILDTFFLYFAVMCIRKWAKQKTDAFIV
jgi:uncharacterized integral membrane protein (TIGR00697 family)